MDSNLETLEPQTQWKVKIIVDDISGTYVGNTRTPLYPRSLDTVSWELLVLHKQIKQHWLCLLANVSFLQDNWDCISVILWRLEWAVFQNISKEKKLYIWRSVAGCRTWRSRMRLRWCMRQNLFTIWFAFLWIFHALVGGAWLSILLFSSRSENVEIILHNCRV